MVFLAALLIASSSQEASFVVAQNLRLAQTPLLDGVIEAEEWQPLADGSYLQWEPGVLYVAAEAEPGRDLLVSLDLSGDGWLIGEDNVELRIGAHGGVSARRLDAAHRDGPRWVPEDLPEGLVRVVRSDSEAKVVFETKILGTGIRGFAADSKLGVRVEQVEPDYDSGAPYLPRETALVTLALDAGENVPTGCSWKSEYQARSVAIGDAIKVRFSMRLEGAAFERVEARVSGAIGRALASMTQPFPTVDSRGRAAINYLTEVPAGQAPGYRVLQARLIRPDGEETVLRTSFRVAEPVIFDVNLPEGLRQIPTGQIVRGSITVRSQRSERYDGWFRVSLPEGWTVSKGQEQRFTIYHARGSARIPVEFVAPADAVGLVPLELVVDLKDRLVTQTVYLRILPPLSQ